MKQLALLFLVFWAGLAQAVEFVTYYGHDPVGNPVAAIGRSQGVIATRDTKAYGQNRFHTGSQAAFGDLGYTGQIDRSNNQLVYFNARYYMPELRRFVSPDPVTVVEGDYKHIDRYGFANGDPMNANDPSGNYAETPWDVFSAAVGWGMFAYDIGQGNYGDATLSGIGALIDSAAVLVPVPGGVSVGIQSARGAKYLSQAGDASAVVAKKVDTPHTINTGGKAPKTSEPNSIIESQRADGSSSVTYYDDKGRAFSREDYGQQSTHGSLGSRADGRSAAHEHRFDYNDRGYAVKQDVYRPLSEGGTPTGSWMGE